jgi:hypothetical protein
MTLQTPTPSSASVLLHMQAVPARKPQREQQIYSLMDDEEEEVMGEAAGASGRGAWAAELGLLALDCCVALQPRVS